MRVVCAAGKRPQRLRALATCATRAAAGGLPAAPQHVALRGEVQAPKVYLKETGLALGTVYVGVPVERTVTLANLSNLATRFKWERPGGPSSAFHLDFSPAQDELAAKEVRDVTVTFVAQHAGVIDEVLGCRVFGMSLPLGFSLTGTAKAAVLAYELLGPDEPPPPALAPPDAPQLPDGVSLPPQPPPPKLDFGAGVPLFERKTVRVAIRNLSAVAASFSVRPTKYPAAGAAAGGPPATLSAPPADSAPNSRAPSRGEARAGRSSRGESRATTSRGASSRGGRMKFILDDSHEADNKFHSKMGRAHVDKRKVEAEDSAVLSRGAGVAFAVEPGEGVLVPWGVLVVTVTAFNNMARRPSGNLALLVPALLCTSRGRHRQSNAAKTSRNGVDTAETRGRASVRRRVSSSTRWSASCIRCRRCVCR